MGVMQMCSHVDVHLVPGGSTRLRSGTMPKETLRDRVDRFIENDFHHLALEVAHLQGQVKIMLMILSIIAVVTIGELVAEILR